MGGAGVLDELGLTGHIVKEGNKLQDQHIRLVIQLLG
jgi:hypothetical protein